MNIVHEQCPKSDSETVLSPKLGWVHRVHTLNPGCAPTAHALRPGLCACSACCVPAHATVCLLSLLYATIQPSLLCACSAFYMPQYNRAYCVPAQPSICHNTAEPIVCLLSLLYATIQLSLLCACSAFYMPAQPSLSVTIQLVYCNTLASTFLLVIIHCSVL